MGVDAKKPDDDDEEDEGDHQALDKYGERDTLKTIHNSLIKLF